MTVSTLFLRTGVISLIVGVGIGMWMGGTGHLEYHHAHAHTNLIGWVSMMIYGFFYRMFPEAEAGLLPKIHAFLAIPALVLMISGTLGTTAGNEVWFLPMIIGELLMGISVLFFTVIVFRATRHADKSAAA